MKYKVGDKVRIKSIDWYNENKDKIGDVDAGLIFDEDMSMWCSKTMTILEVHQTYYTMKEECPSHYWTDEMIEGLAEEEVGLVDEFSSRWVNEFNLPEGYIFKDENGNIINATKIVLEKKKKEYPKTYEECCGILKEQADVTYGYKKDVLHSFQKLLVCRDAYWKIADNWKPFWNNDSQFKYIIICRRDNIIKETYTAKNSILAFPTPEMRDAFYENFKELIESCKELL